MQESDVSTRTGKNNTFDRRTVCEEVADIEMPEDLESVDEDEEEGPSSTPVSNVRLESVVV